MTWYAAHLVEYYKVKTGPQFGYPVYENVVLIEADSPESAIREAERIGRAEYHMTDDTITLDGEPADTLFAGVRCVVECDDTIGREIVRGDAPLVPAHGTEVTYMSFTLESEEDVLKLAAGKVVAVIYESNLRSQ